MLVHEVIAGAVEKHMAGGGGEEGEGGRTAGLSCVEETEAWS